MRFVTKVLREICFRRKEAEQVCQCLCIYQGKLEGRIFCQRISDADKLMKGVPFSQSIHAYRVGKKVVVVGAEERSHGLG